jgi:hypothetical protein
MTFILAFLAAAATQDPPDIPKEVRRILQEHFGRLADPEKIEACATAVSSTIAGARPSEWGLLVLRDLPQAAEFARLSASQFSMLDGVDLQLPPGTGIELPKLPPGLKKEGLHLQMDYFGLQVDRVARKPWTDERRRQAAEQIDQVMNAMEAVLKEKLAGDAGAALAFQSAEELRKVWKAGLDLPYSRVIDGPVTPAELSRVVDGIRNAARAYKTVTLTAEEAGNKARLAELKVLLLQNDVREAALKICAACFAEYAPMEEKCREWEKRAEKAFMEGLPPADPQK